jgi:hypothetical protein
MCNGFPGAVVEVCAGQLAEMVVVRLERMDVCVSISDVDGVPETYEQALVLIRYLRAQLLLTRSTDRRE